MKTNTPVLPSRAAGATMPQQRPAVPNSAPALRQFKVLQSGHAPAQLSLFLRPSGAR